MLARKTAKTRSVLHRFVVQRLFERLFEMTVSQRNPVADPVHGLGLRIQGRGIRNIPNYLIRGTLTSLSFSDYLIRSLILEQGV
jgi:hypothetical protein